MIVVSIIGILAAIAIPNFLSYQAKAKQAEAKTNLVAIHTPGTCLLCREQSLSRRLQRHWLWRDMGFTTLLL